MQKTKFFKVRRNFGHRYGVGSKSQCEVKEMTLMVHVDIISHIGVISVLPDISSQSSQ